MSVSAKGTSPEYDFSRGMRGKYAQRYKERGNVVLLDAPGNEETRIWAPLVNFSWTGSEKQIAEDTWIHPSSAYSGYEQFAYVIAQEEQERCRGISHWLNIARSARDKVSPPEHINLFLMALWIVRPTPTHVPFRFGETTSGTKPFARHLDRFQWLRGQANKDVQDEHIDGLRRALPALRDAYIDGRRLRNALVLTLRGCVSRDWQAAFICFAAAAEALLTYSREPGLTDRLARSYAKLVARSQPAAKRAQEQFKRLYALRSDIVHGRSYERRRSSHNVRELVAFSNVLRRLWGAVLADPDLRSRLEGDDKHREKLFLGL